MHRVTIWRFDDGNVHQLSVACLDDAWEVHAEVTLAVGPFDDPAEIEAKCLDHCHALGGWRAHQLSLPGLGG